MSKQVEYIDILEEIIKQSKVEFNYSETNDETDAILFNADFSAKYILYNCKFSFCSSSCSSCIRLMEIRLPDQQLRGECEKLFNAHVVEMQPVLMPDWRGNRPQGQKQQPRPSWMDQNGWPDFDDDLADWR